MNEEKYVILANGDKQPFESLIYYKDWGFLYINDITVPKLMELGLVKEVIMPDKEFKVPTKLGYYIWRLAEKFDMSVKDMGANLDSLGMYNKIIPIKMLSQEVAYVIDKKYTDHILKSKELWGINAFTGFPRRLNSINKNNYKNFALFRTKEDAYLAINILAKPLADLFNAK